MCGARWDAGTSRASAQSVLRDSWKLLPGSVAGRGPGLRALLDTGAAAADVAHRLRRRPAARNVDEGVVAAVGVVAARMPGRDSAMGTARSVVFIDTRLDDAVADPARAVDVAERAPAQRRSGFGGDPGRFPAVRLSQPASAAGWYIDGGVRMNAPLRLPVVAFGRGSDHRGVGRRRTTRPRSRPRTRPNPGRMSPMPRRWCCTPCSAIA